MNVPAARAAVEARVAKLLVMKAAGVDIAYALLMLGHEIDDLIAAAQHDDDDSNE